MNEKVEKEVGMRGMEKVRKVRDGGFCLGMGI